MVRLKNCTIPEFKNSVKDKRIIVFGAGMMGQFSIDSLEIMDQVEFVVDNDKQKQGRVLKTDKDEFIIISIEELKGKLEALSELNLAILVTPSATMKEIVEQLDSIELLDGTECYLFALLRQSFEVDNRLVFYRSDYEIPKIIHYFWVGGNPIPDNLKQYIDTWKEHCPDYEIIQWNENNYDFSKNSYMKEAYEAKQWAFAPDYARLDVIYNEGGIYFDTDVELLRSPDPLRYCKAFFGFTDSVHIGIGIGFGAIPRMDIIKDMRDYYEDKSFYNSDGTININPSVFYQNPIFKRYGFIVNNNKYQTKDGIVIYPNEVMSPYGCNNYSGRLPEIRESTISIHHNQGSWIAEDKKESKRRQSSLFSRIEGVVTC